MLLLVIAYIIGIIILIYGIIKDIKDEYFHDEGEFQVRLSIVILIITIIFTWVAYRKNMYKQMDYQKEMITHNMLVYQLEENYYNKITYDGRAKLMEKIQNYNKTVLNGRAMKDDIFVGIFFAMDYDNLPLIELKEN